MALAESGSTAVSHPNIIPSFGQHKCWCLLGFIEDPLCHISSHTVLEKDWWALTRDSPDVENILIVGDNLVHLSQIPIFIADLIQGFESIWSVSGTFIDLLMLGLNTFNKCHKDLLEFKAYETEVGEILSSYD